MSENFDEKIFKSAIAKCSPEELVQIKVVLSQNEVMAKEMNNYMAASDKQEKMLHRSIEKYTYLMSFLRKLQVSGDVADYIKQDIRDIIHDFEPTKPKS